LLAYQILTALVYTASQALLHAKCDTVIFAGSNHGRPKVISIGDRLLAAPPTANSPVSYLLLRVITLLVMSPLHHFCTVPTSFIHAYGRRILDPWTINEIPSYSIWRYSDEYNVIIGTFHRQGESVRWDVPSSDDSASGQAVAVVDT
jgi:hypothetical protein